MAIGDSGAVRRYSRALFNVAQERNEVDEVAQNLAQLTQTFANSPELRAVMHHPRITRTRRKELLHQVFQWSVRQDVVTFLNLLVDKDRANIIPHVAQEFLRLVDEHRREADAEVVSAVPLTDTQREAVVQRLKVTNNLQVVRLTTRVDPDILGGLVIRVGDQLIDGSVATQLNTMREQLKRAKIA